MQTVRLNLQERFTIVAVSENVGGDIWSAINQAVELAVDKLNLPGHVRITVVGADVIYTGPGDAECGFAAYQKGGNQIYIAGGDGPTDLGRDEWIAAVKQAAIHELVHYLQDMQGRLEGSQENEDEAEDLAVALLQADGD